MTRYDKMEVLNQIRLHSSYFEKVKSHKDEYLIRCPLCGDSDNPNHAHCYINCSMDPSEPIKWRCFHCPGIPNGGIVGPRFLKALGISGKVANSLIPQRRNKIEIIEDSIKVDIGNIDMNSPQVRYIESRLGKFSEDDIKKFKIVWDINSLSSVFKKQSDRNTLPSNMDSISFLSHDCGMILTRGFNENDGWYKKKITDTNGFYVIESEVDLFTDNTIYVSIGEGIFDVLSAYKNFYEADGYNVFIAALGPDYVAALEHIIAMGIVGNNVEIRFYMDNDRDFKSLISSLRKYKPLFSSMVIRTNLKYKDIGVLRENIKISEKIIR